MNKYPISYVQIHVCRLLEELPFQITRYGKVIAVVNRFNADSLTVKLPENKTILSQVDRPVSNEKVEYKTISTQFKYCVHGSREDLCKICSVKGKGRK